MDIAKSLGQCETPLQREFFSDHNIKILQADLKRGVFCKTNLTIGDQKRDDLLVVMRAMFALYSQNVVPTREIRTEVNRLNDICLREMIPHVADNAVAYMAFRKDASSPLNPIARGENTSSKGMNTYSMFPGFSN
jgi:hypothetical protein